MYLNFFGLESDPFRLDPSLNFVYISKSHEEVIAHLVYGIEQGEDFVLITGGIGTGKTLALHFLLDQIVSSFKTAFVNVTKVDFLELLKLILDDLEIEFEKDWDRADLLAALKSYLLSVRMKSEKVLIIVDEAQNLDADTLEGLRLLGNLAQPGDQVLQIILAGQPGLKRLIASPEMEQLQQRIRVEYQLEELSRREVEEYVQHRMNVAGNKKEVFSRGALDKIFRLSHGVPRLVNQYAGKALLSAFVEESKIVKMGHVEDEEITSQEESVESDPEQEIQPKSILKNKPPKRAIPADEVPARKSGMAREALASLDDVDLDEIRNRRETAHAPHGDLSMAKERSTTRKWLLWAACALVVAAGGMYWSGGWDWLTQRWNEPTPQLELPLQSNLAARTVTQDPRLTPADSTQANPEPGPLDIQGAETAGDSLQVLPMDLAVADQGNPLEVEAPAPVPEPVTSPLSKVLHVASFRNSAQANALVAKLQAQGVVGFVQDQMVNGSTWFRVYLGPFTDLATATRVGQDLKDQNVVMYFRLMEMELEGS